MKIGVSSYSFAAYMAESGCDYLRICDLAKEIGFEGIEFIDLLPEISGADELTTARQIREHCANIGLDIIAYTVGADLLRGNILEEVQRLCRSVDVAHELGAKVMRHDSTRGPIEKGGVFSWQDAVKIMTPAIRQIAEYAMSKDIKTCTENHGMYMQDPERVEQLMRAVAHPNYGWLVDIGNFLCADCDCLKAVAMGTPYAVHAHAKDFLWKSGKETNPGKGWFKTRGGNFLRGTIIGHGVVPVKQCINTLRAGGYNGYLSMEFEGMETNLFALKVGFENLQRMMEEVESFYQD